MPEEKLNIYVELVDKRHIVIRQFKQGSVEARCLDFPKAEDAEFEMNSFLASKVESAQNITKIGRWCYHIT